MVCLALRNAAILANGTTFGAWRSPVSALVWETRGRRFKSSRSDQIIKHCQRRFGLAGLHRSARLQAVYNFRSSLVPESIRAAALLLVTQPPTLLFWRDCLCRSLGGPDGRRRVCGTWRARERLARMLGQVTAGVAGGPDHHRGHLHLGADSRSREQELRQPRKGRRCRASVEYAYDRNRTEDHPGTSADDKALRSIGAG